MTPYYEHAGIRIYHGDCREIGPLLCATVLITDPPYGVEFEGKATKHTTKRTGGYTTGDDAAVGPSVVANVLNRVARGAVFTGNRNLFDYPRPNDVGCVYCPSGAGIGPWGFVCFHPVAFYGVRPSSQLFPCSMESFETVKPNGHPCPKPIGWMRWLVGLTAQANDVILDPFCGSGTTLRAAKDLGLAAIGIEIEERYCEIAAERLRQEVLRFA